jgi:hypothetical protein
MAEIVQARFTEGRTGYEAEEQPVAAEYKVNADQKSPTVDLSQNLDWSSLQKSFRVQGHVRGIDHKAKHDKT